jgi:hypothetical protein
MSQTTHQTSEPVYIGIDFHKHYSVFCVIDERNTVLERGRIDHKIPIRFELLIKRYPGCRVVFETTMNWHWLYEILEAHMDHKDIVLANAYKMRIIAEAQVKTDKVDAYMLAKFLKAELISTVHIPSKSTRQRKEVVAAKMFFRPPAHDAPQPHSAPALGATQSAASPVQRPFWQKRDKRLGQA